MTQTRAGALAALETAIKAAVLAAHKTFVREEEPDATRAGVVVMNDGIPGEPEILLSPVRYCWDHPATFEVAAKGPDRKTTVQAIVALFEPAIAADRTLGGAVDDCRINAAPDAQDFADEDGVEDEYSELVRVDLAYTTTDATR